METGKANNSLLLWIWITLLVESVTEIRACQPGYRYGERRPLKTLVPLVRDQHIPNMSELTIGASGPAEGRITRGSERFKKLVVNYNTLVVFKNEEGTDADRRMTKRCKDRVNTLALLVNRHWPKLKLRVTEAWDEDGDHRESSLHYEGRAVDITTDDRDHAKYGILARLAVEAGFDWVFYESVYHVHASVIADDSDTAIYGGCFPAHATVMTANGVDKPISDLIAGESVWGVERQTGEPKKSEVIMMMHSDKGGETDFLQLDVHSRTAKKSIELTPNHLIYVHSTKTISATWRYGAQAIFASDVSLGDTIYVTSNASTHNKNLELATVISVTKVRHRGLFAPLTRDGTLLVNGVAASCYAVFENERVSHALFWPFRFLWEFGMNLEENTEQSDQQGVHWYPKSIFDFTRKFLPTNLLRTT